MSESPLIATIIHDLAGYLTSVNGFLEIVAARPDHPMRDDLFSSAVEESKTSVQALKDLQLVRSLDKGDLLEDVRAVPLSGVLANVKDRLAQESEATLPPPAPDLPAVAADEEILGDLLARCLLLALGNDPEAASRMHVSSASDPVQIAIGFGAPDEAFDISEGARTGRKIMRPLALARLLLPRWGGSVEVESSETSRLLLHLKRA